MEIMKETRVHGDTYWIHRIDGERIYAMLCSRTEPHLRGNPPFPILVRAKDVAHARKILQGFYGSIRNNGVLSKWEFKSEGFKGILAEEA